MKGHRSRVLLVCWLVVLFSAIQYSAAADTRAASPVRVMRGGHLVGNRIIYRGGAVVVYLAPTSFDTCSAGYVCLWQNINFDGAMVQYQSCCAWNNLANFGFDNVASSWRNRKNVDAQIAAGAGGGTPRLCLNNNSYSGFMPNGWDDVASSIRVRDASTYC
jgi:hypothetical protein